MRHVFVVARYTINQEIDSVEIDTSYPPFYVTVNVNDDDDVDFSDIEYDAGDYAILKANEYYGEDGWYGLEMKDLDDCCDANAIQNPNN